MKVLWSLPDEVAIAAKEWDTEHPKGRLRAGVNARFPCGWTRVEQVLLSTAI